MYEWTNSVKYEEIVIEEKQTEEPIEEENTELQDETTTEETTEEEIIIPKNNTMYSVGSTIKETNVSTELNIRPVVYLKSEVLLITGKGTFEDPYVIR